MKIIISFSLILFHGFKYASVKTVQANTFVLIMCIVQVLKMLGKYCF